MLDFGGGSNGDGIWHNPRCSEIPYPHTVRWCTGSRFCSKYRFLSRAHHLLYALNDGLFFRTYNEVSVLADLIGRSVWRVEVGGRGGGGGANSLCACAMSRS